MTSDFQITLASTAGDGFSELAAEFDRSASLLEFARQARRFHAARRWIYSINLSGAAQDLALALLQIGECRGTFTVAISRADLCRLAKISQGGSYTAARSDLVSNGVIEVLDSGGGAGNTAVYLFRLPPWLGFENNIVSGAPDAGNQGAEA